jgi:hypothetical protein
MRSPLVAIICLLAGFTASGQVRVSVTTDTNGNLLAPINFFQHNAKYITNMINSALASANTNAVWPVAGNNTTTSTNGTAVTVNADVSHLEVAGASNVVSSNSLSWLALSNAAYIDRFYTNHSPSITLGSNSTLVGGSNTVELVNGANSQRMNIYMASNSATDYRRASVQFIGNSLYIGSDNGVDYAGGGDTFLEASGSHHIGFRTSGTNWWNVEFNGTLDGIGSLAVGGVSSFAQAASFSKSAFFQGGLWVTNRFGPQCITNAGSIWYWTNGTPQLSLPDGSMATGDGNIYTRTNGAWVALGSGGGGGGGGSGTVTSVGLSTPSEFTPAGTPVTGSGTLSFSRTAGVTANYVGQTGTNFANLVSTNTLGVISAGNVLDLTNAFQLDTVAGRRMANVNTNGDAWLRGNLSVVGNYTLGGNSTVAGNVTSSGTFSGTSVQVTSATASTLPLFDSGKNFVSLANPSSAGTWMLTSDGSGTKTWVLSVSGSALQTNAVVWSDGGTNLVNTNRGWAITVRGASNSLWLTNIATGVAMTMDTNGVIHGNGAGLTNLSGVTGGGSSPMVSSNIFVDTTNEIVWDIATVQHLSLQLTTNLNLLTISNAWAISNSPSGLVQLDTWEDTNGTWKIISTNIVNGRLRLYGGGWIRGTNASQYDTLGLKLDATGTNLLGRWDTNAQPIMTFAGDIGGGGGGGGGTSYANVGGTGDRQSIITVGGTAITGTAEQLVDGLENNSSPFMAGGAADGSTITVTFNSGSSAYFDEFTFVQDTSVAQGVWKWQSSDNGSTWTDVGSSFTLTGSLAGTVNTEPSGASTPHRYWQMIKVSGSTNPGPLSQELKFKISTGL